MKSVLIIGANGFIGSRAVRAFLDAGWQVHTYGPPGQNDLLAEVSGRYKEYAGILQNEGALLNVLQQASPSVVVSFAAHSVGGDGLVRTGVLDPHGTLTLNVAGYYNLFECCHALGVRRVLWTSSTSVFGPARFYEREPLDEDAPGHALTVYGVSKIMLEALARYHSDRFGMQICALRPPLVFGQGRWYVGAAGALMQLFQQAQAGNRPRVAAAPDPIDLIYGDDVARAVLHLAEFGGALKPVYHLKGFTATHRQIAAMLQELVPGYAPEIDDVPGGERHPLMSAQRIADDTGFAPKYDLRAACLAYLRSLGR